MNDHSLDLHPAKFKELLDQASQLVIDQFTDLESKKAYHSHPQKEVESWFDEPLPKDEMHPEDVLDLVKKKVMDKATNNLGPYMYAYVMAGGTQISILAELLAATINQNVGKWHLAPSINEIEKRVVQWGGEITGFDENAAGVVVSGGSAANLAGLTVARNLFFEKNKIREKGLFGIKPFTVYASKEVHGCVDKSIEELGIGTNQLRKIDTNDGFTIDLQALEHTINEDVENGFTPFCIIGNAGTVNTGAIDDMNALADIAQKHGLWFHVDGAYGGLVGTLPSLKEKYKGIERADSLAVDFHKWLYQTFEGGCLLVKNWSNLKRTYFKVASYLDTSMEEQGRINFNEHHFQLSRNAKALKIWMSLKTYGINRIQDMIQKDIDLAQYLSDSMDESKNFELVQSSDLAISCFRYVGDLQNETEIDAFNRKMIPALEKDGRVFITGTTIRQKFVIRACLINHRMNKRTVDYLINVLEEVADQIK